VLKALLSIVVLSTLLIGCGNDENGIPFRQPQGSEDVPQSVENRLESLEDGKTTVSTKSSQNIKEETIGLNIDITHRDTKRGDIRVTVSYSEGAGTCSQALYHVKDFSLSNIISKTKIEGFGEITCSTFNKSTKRCDYLFVKITQTPSSILAASGSSSTGSVIPAAVYAIMKNLSSNPMSDNFIPSRTDRDNYLQIPEGTNDYQYCMKPQQVTQEASDVTYIIDPTSDITGDYDYDGYDFGNGYF
jgi:hypothetical protein